MAFVDTKERKKERKRERKQVQVCTGVTQHLLACFSGTFALDFIEIKEYKRLKARKLEYYLKEFYYRINFEKLGLVIPHTNSQI